MPLTSTVETFSHHPLHQRALADATLGVATMQARPEKARPEKARPYFAMPPRETARFPRSARLLRHADFERVYKQGRRHFSASMTVFYWPRPAAQTPATTPASTSPAGSPTSSPNKGLRIGFTVGRALGGAVQRNCMKRRLREAVRMTLPAAPISADVVINPKKSLLTTDFAAVRNEVTRAFAVIEQKLSQTTAEKAQTETSTKRTAEARKPEPDSRS